MLDNRTLTALTTAGIGVAARGANQLVLLLVTVVATRFLTPSDFGVFSVAAACITFVRTILYSGAFEYLLKTPQPEAASTECLLLNVLTSGILSAALYLLSLATNALFDSHTLGHLLALMIPANFVAGLTAWQEALFLRSGKVRRYYFITLTIEIFSAAVTIILFYLGLGILSLVVQTYLRNLAFFTIYALVQSPIWSSHPSFAAGLMIARWSLGRYLAILTSFTSNYGADFVLSAFVSTAAAGLYRASNRIVTAVSDLFAQPARMLAVTLFSRRAARKRRTRRGLAEGVRGIRHRRMACFGGPGDHVRYARSDGPRPAMGRSRSDRPNLVPSQIFHDPVRRGQHGARHVGSSKGRPHRAGWRIDRDHTRALAVFALRCRSSRLGDHSCFGHRQRISSRLRAQRVPCLQEDL